MTDINTKGNFSSVDHSKSKRTNRNQHRAKANRHRRHIKDRHVPTRRGGNRLEVDPSCLNVPLEDRAPVFARVPTNACW